MGKLKLNIDRKCCFCSQAVTGLEFSGLELTSHGHPVERDVLHEFDLSWPLLCQLPSSPKVITGVTLQTWQWHWWNALWLCSDVTCIAWASSLLMRFLERTLTRQFKCNIALESWFLILNVHCKPFSSFDVISLWFLISCLTRQRSSSNTTLCLFRKND